MFEEISIEKFTEKLASSDAVPGGGGASALAGAVASSLGNMVGSLTTGKKKYADVQDDIENLMDEAEMLREKFLSAIEEDAKAFEPLSKAYSIPKDEEGRDAELERCLKIAAASPLEIFDLCCKAIEVIEGFAEKGSKIVISDAATGAAICEGALKGAAVNVTVNTRLMKDRAYAEKLDEHIALGMRKYCEKAQAVYDMVCDKLAGRKGG